MTFSPAFDIIFESPHTSVAFVALVGVRGILMRCALSRIQGIGVDQSEVRRKVAIPRLPVETTMNPLIARDEALTRLSHLHVFAIFGNLVPIEQEVVFAFLPDALERDLDLTQIGLEGDEGCRITEGPQE